VVNGIYPRFEYNFIGCGSMSTLRGLSTDGSLAAYNQFSSAHSGIVQFAVGDGSVRGLRPGNTATPFSPDWYLLQQLSGYKDGLSADTSAIQ